MKLSRWLIVVAITGLLMGAGVAQAMHNVPLDRRIIQDWDPRKIMEWLSHPLLGSMLGLLLGFPLGLWAATRRLGWLGTFVLNSLAIAATYFNGWPGFLYVIVPWAIALFISGNALRELYDGRLRRALLRHLQIVTGTLAGVQIIDDGKTILPKQMDLVDGPRLVIVRPGNAVILEQGEKQTHVYGPKIVQTGAHETVKRIINLREQQKRLALDNVVTDDFAAVTVTVSVTYGPMIGQEARNGLVPFSPQDEAIIQHTDAWLPDADAAVLTAIEAAVRHVVGTEQLADVVPPVNPQALEARILSDANLEVAGWFLAVSSLLVESVKPVPEILAANVAANVEQSRVAGWSAAVSSLARAYAGAIAAPMPKDRLYQDILRRQIEAITKDPTAKKVTSPGVEATLEDLRRSLEDNPEVTPPAGAGPLPLPGTPSTPPQ